MSSDPLSILMASGRMPVDTVVRIGCQLALSLAETHGELSPSVIEIDGDRVDVRPPGNVDRMRYGQYSAPERILGKPPTPSSDVYSIAAILYHAMAGYPPFRGDSPAAMMLAACSELPQKMPAHVPQHLEQIFLRALSKDPAYRYATPAVFADELAAFARQTVWEGRRVLAADDDLPIRVLYQRMISRIGVEADVVTTGRDVIEALKSRKYDVVLLDLNLPRLSGWEVLDFLRTRIDLLPRHLFIVTGFSDQRVSEADRTLVSAVLYKPVAADELTLLVTECLRGGTPDLTKILRETRHRVIAA